MSPKIFSSSLKKFYIHIPLLEAGYYNRKCIQWVAINNKFWDMKQCDKCFEWTEVEK